MFEQQGLSPFPANLPHDPGGRDHLDDVDPHADYLYYADLLDVLLDDHLDDADHPVAPQ